MTLRLQIDPGGEKYFGFAQKKLAALKEWMMRAKMGSITKHFKIDDSDIWLNSVHAGHGVFLDWIRITAGGGWVFYVRQITPEPYLYVSALYGQPAAVAADQGVIASSRAKSATGHDRAYAISSAATGFDIVLPDRKVQLLRPLVFPTGYGILGITAGPTGAAVLARDSGASWVFGDLADKNIVVADSGTSTYALFSTLDNKFFFQRLNVELYGLDGETADFTIDPLSLDPFINTRVNASPAATGYDVFGLKFWDSTDPTLTYNFTATELISGRTGTSAGVLSIGSATPLNSASIDDQYTVLVTNRLNAYAFASTRDGVGNQRYVMRQKLIGMLSPAGVLSYASSSGSTPVAEFRTDSLFWGGAATLTDGYAFLITTPDGITTDVSAMNSSGAIILLESGILNHAEFVGRVSAASPNHAWLATFFTDSISGDTGLKIYNETGLKATFPNITDQTLTNAALTFAGYAGDNTYFRLKISATEYRMLGSDGSSLDPAIAWPSGFILTSIGGHIWASKSGEVNWLTAGATLEPILPSGFAVRPQVTHIAQNSAVQSYPIPTEGAPILVVPDPASCFVHQIFEL